MKKIKILTLMLGLLIGSMNLLWAKDDALTVENFSKEIFYCGGEWKGVTDLPIQWVEYVDSVAPGEIIKDPKTGLEFVKKANEIKLPTQGNRRLVEVRVSKTANTAGDYKKILLESSNEFAKWKLIISKNKDMTVVKE